MKFTDIFIKRPVLSTVVSLLIFFAGLACINKLPLQEYPQMTNTVITVTTVYPGASSDVVQGFVTLPLEKSIGSANGIDYMTAQSTTGQSVITIYVTLNYDPNTAFTDINSKVTAVLSQLPQGTQAPVLDKQTAETMPPDLVIGFTSNTLSPEAITAYVNNVVIPKLHETNGVGQTQFWGEKNYAMRIWLNSEKMAQLNIEPADVYNAINNNNYQAAPGSLKPHYNWISLTINTDLHDADAFKNMVVKNENGHLVRLKDVANVELSSQNVDTQAYYNGEKAEFVGINASPGVNPLTVVQNLKKAFPEMEAHFPPGLSMSIAYDSTTYIQAAIDEVIKTIIEAILIVVVVIFLFLGAFRSVLIPVVAIPLSLIGVAMLMEAMGFSLNLLTLLALVLAVGLVVDDAIVVLENIYRHLEEGLTPFQASIKGAREITGPIIVMTVTLAAVFAPIGFMGGLTGALFQEFAFTLAASVVISGVVALTFSPMLCSKLITRELMHSKTVQIIDRVFSMVRAVYERCLHSVLNYRSAVIIVAVTVFLSCAGMFMMTPKELAPQEDMGFIGVFALGPSSATLDFIKEYNPAFKKLYQDTPDVVDTFEVDGFPTNYQVVSGVILKPWAERKLTAMEIAPQVMANAGQVIGLNTFSFQLPSLPGVQPGPPVNFVITSTQPYAQIFPVAQALIKKAYATGKFVYVDSDLKFDVPQVHIEVNRSKAADLGISMSQIGNALALDLGGNYINYFSAFGYSYEVIPQLARQYWMKPADLNLIHVRAANGTLIPLSSLITYTQASQPVSLNQFQQLNSATISLIPFPGVTQAEALQILEQIANEDFPKSMSYDFAGQSRQYVQEGNALIFAFFFGLIVIFLVLAAQFESFRDPFIVLVSVPMSIFGALLPLYLGAASINIYTEIGLITLIGLISKHGILMVEFANKLQEHERLGKREAIEKAAATRLRPILMTTFAMVFGVVPLITAFGAGAVSRFCVGIVIASGMTIGTIFTLFVVPTMYTFFAKDRLKYLSKQAEIQVMPPEDDIHGH